MQWTLFLSLSKYKIATFVVIAHILPLCFLSKEKGEKPPLSSSLPKPIVLHTYIHAPKESSLKQKESIEQRAPAVSSKKITPKKEPSSGKKPVHKKAGKPNKIAMQKVDKIFANIKNIKPISPPSSHPVEMLETPSEVQLSSKMAKKESTEPLFDYLQTIIELPKKGSIKLSFSVDLKGNISHLQIEEKGADAENIAYVKQLFADLLLPKEVINACTSPSEIIYITLHGVAE